MGKEVRVSIALIVYNHENYIKQALDSILRQKTEYEYEIVIGDDASTDNSQSIIKEYADKYSCIKPILREKNVGASENSYDTYYHCRGEYLCILEGDDFWIDDTRLQRQVDFLDAHPEMWSVAARRKRVNEDGEIIPYKHFRNTEILTPKSIGKMCEMVHISTFMFRNIYIDEQERRSYERLRGFHSIIGDWTRLCYYLDKSDIYIFPETVSAIRRILRPDASNFNSIYRYKKNKYDVMMERINYERNLTNFPFKRVNITYSVYKKAALFWYTLVRDKNAESKSYGKKLYKEEILPRLSLFKRIMVPLGVVSVFYSRFKDWRYNRICKEETKDELGEKLV